MVFYFFLSVILMFVILSPFLLKDLEIFTFSGGAVYIRMDTLEGYLWKLAVGRDGNCHRVF
jgi:hypothetical protein